MTTSAFLNSLKRFISRRGMCSHIYSDNGTNFIGAKRELREFREIMISNQVNESLENWSANQGIKWSNITPRAPHQGGLWEAAVKSIKYHLARVMRDACLTYEELYTILVQVEACLNSRPLLPITCHPDDLECLTPAHFLIGTAMNAIPEPDVRQIPLTKLNRYQLLSKLVSDFWKKWSTEYLGTSQIRSKWLQSDNNIIKEGDMVIVKEDNIPPLKWQLGKVLKLHPGKDNCVRNVTLQVQNGKIQRPIQRLCLMPKHD